MCGPDGACVACGLPCDGKQWTHEDCHQSVTDWNKVIDDFVNDWRARGASDAEIQQEWNDTLGQWHAQGLQKDFFDSLEH